MSKIKNKVVRISNYCTSTLQKILSEHAEEGYRVISSTVAPNEYGVLEMFLFFTKEEKENKNKKEGGKSP